MSEKSEGAVSPEVIEALERLGASLPTLPAGSNRPKRLRFPVQVPYRVASDLAKLEGSVLETDAEFQACRALKIELLRQRPDALLLPRKSLPADLWIEVSLALGLAPDTTSPDGVSTNAITSALSLTLAMQEDWVLLGPEGRFEAGSVCFPSGWVPAEKFGQDLMRIHAPVADGEPLRKASAALTRAMLEKGPFQRFVWTLTESAGLARHPYHPGDFAVPGGGGLYFRYERQTTLPLPKSRHALFLIRVVLAPLEQVLLGEGTASQNVERLARLQQSLASMSPAVIEYKGLARIREKVLSMAL